MFFYGISILLSKVRQGFCKNCISSECNSKKEPAILWNDEAQTAFDKLKIAMTTTPILAMPTDEDEYTLDTDASDFAIEPYFCKNRTRLSEL